MAGLIQYIPGNTVLHRLDPRNKLALAVTVLIMAFVLNRLEHLLVVFALVVIIWFYIKAPLSLMRNLLLILMVFACFIILIQGLFWAGSPRTPFIDLVPSFIRQGFIAQILGETGDPGRHLVLAKEGVLFGVFLTLRLGVILSIMPLITIITPIKDLSMALEKLGAPSQIAYLILTTFRFIPLLINQTGTILNAQKLRGLDVEKAGLIKRITAYAPLAVPVILGAFRNSQQLEMVLECRGFTTSRNRTSLYEINWKTIDTFALSVLVFLLVIALFTRFGLIEKMLI